MEKEPRYPWHDDSSDLKEHQQTPIWEQKSTDMAKKLKQSQLNDGGPSMQSARNEQKWRGSEKIYKERKHAMHRTQEALAKLGAGKAYGEK